MAVGGGFEVWYPLSAPIAGGSYHISVGGYNPSRDAQLHADLLYRPAVGQDVVIASASSNVAPGSDAGVVGDIDATVAGAPVPAKQGDLLVLRVKMVSGTDGYIEIGTNLTLP